MLPLQQRTLCGVVAALALVLIVPALGDARVPGWERLLLAGFVVAAALTPRAAALAIIVAIPLAFLGPPVSGTAFRLTEALVVGVLGGWSVRACARRSQTLPGSLWAPLLVAAAALTCSAVVVAASGTTDSPRMFHAELVQTIRGDYFLDAGPLEPARVGFMQIQALALFAAGAAMAIGAPLFVASFARMLVAGAAATATLNLQRLAQISLRSDAPFEALRHAIRGVRINVSYGDVNAAGSFFALCAVVGARLSAAGPVANAVAGAGATAVIVAAMWLTGSRAAVAAFLVVCAGLLLMVRRSARARTAAVAGLAACAGGAILFVLLFPNRVAGTGTSLGWLVRTEMAKVSLRMTSDHPWFGVGVGRFYDASASYLPSTRIAQVYTQENAHNNYLQILAELGITGALAVLWLFVASARCAVRDLPSASAARVALTAGLVTFGATMLLGHPLLIADVCYTFAAAAGVAVGAGVIRRESGMPRWLSSLSIAATLALIATVPIRIHAARASANFDQVAWGLGPWQAAPDGERARPMIAKATLFVPTNVAIVEIPFRLDHPGAPVTLSVTYHNHPADPIVASSTEWSRYRLVVGNEKRGVRYEQLTLSPQTGDATNVLLGKLVEY